MSTGVLKLKCEDTGDSGSSSTDEPEIIDAGDAGLDWWGEPGAEPETWTGWIVALIAI